MQHGILAIILIQSALAQAPRYTVHDLGPLNSGAVTGINIKGQVIGYDTLPDSRVRSFRTAPNAPINWTTDDLGSLGGATTRAFGINASGQVVGSSTLSTGEFRGFRTAPNKPVQPATDNIGTLDGRNTQALAINDLGQVTGSSGDHAFLTAPNSAIDPATGNIDVNPDQRIEGNIGVRINSRGHVLGEIVILPVNAIASLHTERAGMPIPDARIYLQHSYAGLTEQDQIVFNSSSDLRLWQGGKTVLLAKCSNWCMPSSVNNSLQVVVSSAPNPLLYSDGMLYDFTTLVPPSAPPALSPRYINDLGQVAGTATINNETHAIRLDPVTSAVSAMRQALIAVRALTLDRRVRNALPLILKATLASKLIAALDSWSQGNPAATRGFLNEFENVVRAHAGKSLSPEQADQLLEMAETAIELT